MHFKQNVFLLLGGVVWGCCFDVFIILCIVYNIRISLAYNTL